MKIVTQSEYAKKIRNSSGLLSYFPSCLSVALQKALALSDMKYY